MISGYINSTPFSVYAYGEILLQDGGGSHYISWTPTNISGQFSMEGSTYNLEDYDGYFEFNGSSITQSAFYNRSIQTMETDAELIGERAFMRCYYLESISMSNCTYISSAAFADCASLYSVYAPNVEYVSAFAFERCYSLTTIDLPACEYIGREAFEYCYSLTSIHLSVCSQIGYSAFKYCSSLTTIDLPSCENIGMRAFEYCSSLTSIHLPVCSQIGHGAFEFCTDLSIITLGNSSVCTLISGDIGEGEVSFAYINFLGTQFFSGIGSIYVPSSLVSAYKADSGWSSLSSLIFPINN